MCCHQVTLCVRDPLRVTLCFTSIRCYDAPKPARWRWHALQCTCVVIDFGSQPSSGHDRDGNVHSTNVVRGCHRGTAVAMPYRLLPITVVMAVALTVLGAVPVTLATDWIHPRCANGSIAYAEEVARTPLVVAMRPAITRMSPEDHAKVFLSRALASVAPYTRDSKPPWRGPKSRSAGPRGASVCDEMIHGQVHKVGNWECESTHACVLPFQRCKRRIVAAVNKYIQNSLLCLLVLSS